MLKFSLGASLLALAIASAPAAAQTTDPAPGGDKVDAPLSTTGSKSSSANPSPGPGASVKAPSGGTATPSGSSGSKIDAPLTDTGSPGTASAPSGGSPLDTNIPGDTASQAAPPPPLTGNPILDRLNALEAKVNQLEARNHQLEAQAVESQTRIQKVEVRAAKEVQFGGPAPTFADLTDNFTFKPRGTIQVDYAGFNERRGGYDYNNGTDIRRARFGFDGTAFKAFKWRIEAEYVKNTVNLLDAYVQYAGIKNWVFTIGQHKAPYGLEANSSDPLNTFLERAMFVDAFIGIGADRRVGASAAYLSDHLNFQAGLFGSGEGVQRSSTSTPDEAWGGNARVTWDPIIDAGRLVHVGASGFRVTDIGGNAFTAAVRPETRVDGGNIISAAIAGTHNAQTGVDTGVKTATYWGLEAAGIYGPFSVQGEYGHLNIDRFGTLPDVDFHGFYAFASFFVTGESRVFKNGVVDRVKPFSNFDGAGGIGAIELDIRYDRLNLTDSGLSPLRRVATTWTAAANWYLNPYTKVLFNYIRFKGTNSPLVFQPNPLVPSVGLAKGDAFATRLQFDF